MPRRKKKKQPPPPTEYVLPPPPFARSRWCLVAVLLLVPPVLALPLGVAGWFWGAAGAMLASALLAAVVSLRQPAGNYLMANPLLLERTEAASVSAACLALVVSAGRLFDPDTATTLYVYVAGLVGILWAGVAWQFRTPWVMLCAYLWPVVLMVGFVVVVFVFVACAVCGKPGWA